MRRAASSLLMMIAAIVLAILLITWLWPVVVGLFFTIVLGAILGYITMLVMKQRLNGGGGGFGYMDFFGWPLVAGVIVFLVVLVIGFNITMAVWNAR